MDYVFDRYKAIGNNLPIDLKAAAAPRSGLQSERQRMYCRIDSIYYFEGIPSRKMSAKGSVKGALPTCKEASTPLMAS